jgi:hypothetical protein
VAPNGRHSHSSGFVNCLCLSYNNSNRLATSDTLHDNTAHTTLVKDMLWPTVSWPGTRLMHMTRFLFFLLGVCWCHAPSLTRGWACRLEWPLDIMSAAILSSVSLRTLDLILLSQIWDSQSHLKTHTSPRNNSLYHESPGYWSQDWLHWQRSPAV